MPDRVLPNALERRLFTVPEVAERYGVSTRTVFELIRSGQLKSVKVARRSRRVPLSALDDYEQRLITEASK